MLSQVQQRKHITYLKLMTAVTLGWFSVFRVILTLDTEKINTFKGLNSGRDKVEMN